MEIRLKIENDMSKAEEIDILKKLRDAYTIHPDNYLTILFSNRFINWAIENIKNDFPVDPMEYIMEYITAYSKREREKEIKDLKEKLEEAQQGIIEMNEVAHNLTETARYYKEEQYKLECLVSEKISQIDKRNIKLNELENCIVNFKAKLYDLMA